MDIEELVFGIPGFGMSDKTKSKALRIRMQKALKIKTKNYRKIK